MARFGFGAKDPIEEQAQLAQDRATAFEGIKDNLPALGLIAGLSMLAHNNGSRSVGQLVGRAGADALSAYGTWQKLEEARQRQKLLDEERKEQREYDRSQDAFRNDLAERKFGLEQAKMAQDMQLARQRMGLAYAGLAAQRQAQALAAAKEREKEEFDKQHREVGGVWYDLQPDGTWDVSKTLNMWDSKGNMISGKTQDVKPTDVKGLYGDWKSDSEKYLGLSKSTGQLFATIAKKNPTAADDLASIFGFMKSLDNNSVVREGEQLQARRTGGITDTFISYVNQLQNGKMLTPQQRANFLRTARDILQNETYAQRLRNKNYSDIAASYGINPSYIIRDPYAGQLSQIDDWLAEQDRLFAAGGGAGIPGAGAGASASGGGYIPGVKGRPDIGGYRIKR